MKNLSFKQILYLLLISSTIIYSFVYPDKMEGAAGVCMAAIMVVALFVHDDSE